MTEKKTLTPKSQWHELSIFQLNDLKTDFINLYYDMSRVGASNARDFLSFSEQVDALIAQKQAQEQAEKEIDPD